MFLVFPVYNSSFCFSKSVHPAALPGPAYPYVDHHTSVEFHAVSWISGPWSSLSSTVYGDFHRLTLAGHDVGMMIPHVSTLMDNILLPLTLLTSSCKWPFVSHSKKAVPESGKEAKGLVAFMYGVVPFVHCDEPPDKQKPTNQDAKPDAKPAKPAVEKVDSDDLQGRRLGQKPGEAVDAAKEVNKLASFAEAIGINKGRGIVYIPSEKTVIMSLSYGDFVLAVFDLWISKSFAALAGAMLKPLKLVSRDSLKRLDSSAALGAATSWAKRYDAGKVIYSTVAVEALWNGMLVDGVLKSQALDGKFSAPYGLFSYKLRDGKGAFLFWGSLEGEPSPIKWKGLQTFMKDTIKDNYQPPVDIVTADNPNYAAAPSAEGGAS